MFILEPGNSKELKGYGAFYIPVMYEEGEIEASEETEEGYGLNFDGYNDYREPGGEDIPRRKSFFAIFAQDATELKRHIRDIEIKFSIESQGDVTIKGQRVPTISFLRKQPPLDDFFEECSGDFIHFYPSSSEWNSWSPELSLFLYSYHRHFKAQKAERCIDSPFFNYRMGNPQKLSGRGIVYFKSTSPDYKFPAYIFGANMNVLKEFCEQCAPYDKEIAKRHYSLKKIRAPKKIRMVSSGRYLTGFNPTIARSFPFYFDLIELDAGSRMISAQYRLEQVVKMYLSRYKQQQKETEKIFQVPAQHFGHKALLETYVRRVLFNSETPSSTEVKIPLWWRDQLFDLRRSEINPRHIPKGAAILQAQLTAVWAGNYERAGKCKDEYAAFLEKHAIQT